MSPPPPPEVAPPEVAPPNASTSPDCGAIRRRFAAAHRLRLRQWYESAPSVGELFPERIRWRFMGRFVAPHGAPSTREHLWNALALLASDDPADHELANAVLLRVPIDDNYFLPVSAVELLLRHRDRLTHDAVEHLMCIVREYLPCAIDVRFGNPHQNNFSCMNSFYLLACSRLLKRYEPRFAFAGIAEIYNHKRLEAMGLNGLYALAHLAETCELFDEFNSPTYTPISLMALAKIVELSPNAQAAELAQSLEQNLWRQVLAFYHPRLNTLAGPYGRAYRIDLANHASQARILLAGAGVSGETSIEQILEGHAPHAVVHHAGDLPFNWAGAAWLMSTSYHLPDGWRQALSQRSDPYRHVHHIRWDTHGEIDRERGRFLRVQGEALRSGEADVVQIQHADWVLGYRTRSEIGQCPPMSLHYRIEPSRRDMAAVRPVVGGLVFHNEPSATTLSPDGRVVEADHLENWGDVAIREDGPALRFVARPDADLQPLASDESSVNMFWGLHFKPLDEVQVNGVTLDDDSVELTGDRMVCDIYDSGFHWRVTYAADRPLRMRCGRWSNYLRLTAFWHAGEPRVLDEAFYQQMQLHGVLELVTAPPGSLAHESSTGAAQ